MSFLAYLTDDDNLVPLPATVVTASSHQVLYPAANLAALPLSETWEATGRTNEAIKVDFGSAKPVNFMALLNHNFSSSATLTLKAGTSPAVDVFSVSLAWRARDIYKTLSATQSFRYWEIDIQDGSNPALRVEAGYLMLGVRTQLAVGFRYGWRRKHGAATRSKRSELGVVQAAALYRAKMITIDFDHLTETQASTLAAWLLALDKDVVPLFIVPNPDSYEGYFVRLQNEPEEQFQGYVDVQLLKLEFNEEPNGVRLPA